LLKWYQEPFIHFIILGVILFFLIDINSEQNSRKIVATQEDVSAVLKLWNRDHNNTPTDKELEELLKEYNQNEILYREALLRNLDKDDEGIKKILVDKLKYAMSDSLDISEVSNEVLENYFRKNKSKFFNKSQINLTFGHIYLNPQEHTDMDKVTEELLKNVNNMPYAKDISKKGDNFYAGDYFNNLTMSELSKSFSHSFVRNLIKLPKEKWSVIRSGYGVHLVYIVDITHREMKFDEIKDKVKDRYIIEKNRDAYKVFYKNIKDKYSIIIDNSTNKNGILK
jgi:hypothetical protein